ncbi:type II toxin-antitoxin system ParD family antitoxin [Pseudomonas sp. Z1-12]|uniref:ribbon-helix-helix domain-containing protein n=1 Tax=Pseudomonas sp. Z1-12 TaxID=2817408 RepID=UPI003DA8618C
MSTQNISLPDALKSFVDDQVSLGGYSTRSEYAQELIRKDQNRQHLRGLVLAGLESAPTVPVSSDYFECLRAKVRGDDLQSQAPAGL